MLRWYHRDEAGGISEAVNRVQFLGRNPGNEGMVVNAEEGSTGRARILVDDPDGTFEIRGHRKLYAVETEAITDPYAGVMGVWYMGNRSVAEASPFDGTGRAWTIDIDDLNTVLSRRIMLGKDADRPAETDVARMTWLLGTNELSLIDDDTYLSTTNPVDMDAADLRKQSVQSIIDDCARSGRKNWFVLNLKQTPDAEGDPNLFSMFYGPPDEAGVRESVIRISNDPADADADTFAPAGKSTLNIDHSRVYGGAVVEYDGGYVYVKRPQTTTRFALGGRDTTLPAPNIKSKATAEAYGHRHLNDLASEEYIIETAIVVTASRVNDLFWGDRVQVRFTWMPFGFDAWTWGRVVNRTVLPLAPEVGATEGLYEIACEISVNEAAAAAPSAFGILHQSQGPNSSVVYWSFTGDNPHPGYIEEPTTGLIEVVEDLTPPNGTWPYTGWKVTGTGTIDVEFFATVVGVLVSNTLFSITYAIRKNGVVVASAVSTAQGALEFWGDEKLVTIAGLSVVPNDVIDATITCIPPTMPFFRTPGGTGQNGERLEITDGSLS